MSEKYDNITKALPNEPRTELEIPAEEEIQEQVVEQQEMESLSPDNIEISENEYLSNIPTALTRTSTYLEQTVFNSYHSESKMMRYIKFLENKHKITRENYRDYEEDFIYDLVVKKFKDF